MRECVRLVVVVAKGKGKGERKAIRNHPTNQTRGRGEVGNRPVCGGVCRGRVGGGGRKNQTSHPVPVVWGGGGGGGGEGSPSVPVLSVPTRGKEATTMPCPISGGEEK